MKLGLSEHKAEAVVDFRSSELLGNIEGKHILSCYRSGRNMFGVWNMEYVTPADLSSRIIINRMCNYLIKTNS